MNHSMDTPIVVQISEGSLRGLKKNNNNGESFHSFEGIRYGEPPVGKLRFKAPVPARPWSGVKDAIQPDTGCLRKKVEFRDETERTSGCVLEGSEDCLKLNVYTRLLPSSGNTELKPVMFYVHGGAFTIGSTEGYGADFLVAEDVVLVTIHYRLGVFGFLAMEDPKLGVTGNAGMKDQVLALKWVQRNISAFNGDPNNVTIFGHSAGAASIAFLVLSPRASGLFHRAIIQSGCALNNWVRGNPQNAKRLSEVLCCSKTDDRDVLQFLQDMPAEELYHGQLMMGDIIEPASVRYFSPIIEPLDSGEEAFLTVEPIELLKSGRFNQVPIMIGYTDMEAILFLIENKDCPFRVECFDKMAQPPFWLGLKKGSREFINVADKIRQFYYKDVQPEVISIPTIEMASDIGIIRGVIKFGQHVAESSDQKVYLYRIRTAMHHQEPFCGKKITGALHGIELPLLFKMDQKIKYVSADEGILRKQFLRMWTNFAKYGNPTPAKDTLIPITWKPLKKNEMNFLDICDNLSMEVDPEKIRMDFWDEICQSYQQSDGY